MKDKITFYLHQLKGITSDDIVIWREVAAKKDQFNPYKFRYNLEKYSNEILEENEFVFKKYIPERLMLNELLEFISIIAENNNYATQEQIEKGMLAYRTFSERWTEDENGNSWGKVVPKK